MAREPRGICAEPPSLYRRPSPIREPRAVGDMVEGPRRAGGSASRFLSPPRGSAPPPFIYRGCRNRCEVQGRWYVPALPRDTPPPAVRACGDRAVVTRERVGSGDGDGVPVGQPMSPVLLHWGNRVEAGEVRGVSRGPSGHGVSQRSAGTAAPQGWRARESSPSIVWVGWCAWARGEPRAGDSRTRRLRATLPGRREMAVGWFGIDINRSRLSFKSG